MNVDKVRVWRQKKAQAAELEKQAKALKAEAAGLMASIIDDMIGEGVDSVGCDDRTTYITEPFRAKKASEEIETADIVAALDEAGWGEIAPRGFNWQTLTSRLREHVEEGGEVPEPLAAVLICSRVHELGDRAR